MARRSRLFLLRCLVVLLACVTTALSFAGEGHNLHAGNLEKLFEQHGVTGAFAARDTGTNDQAIVLQADKRRVPASTFKIANSLIALETGVVADADTVIPYGGKPQPIKSWQQDMSMRDAIRISNVPIYQELARRVGSERYREWLVKLGYGNRRTGEDVERFWLDGPLAISPLEQVDFLARLIRDELPASVDNQQTVRDLVHVETSDRGKLHAKTGWSIATEPQTGWWVGWVEREDTTIAFALTIDMASRADAGKREALGRALLRALQVY